MRVFRNSGRIAHDSHFKLDVPIGEEPGLEVLEDMLLKSYVRRWHFFMDQEPPHVVWLTNKRPRIAAKILTNNEWVSGDELRFRYNVKGRPKRRLEYCHA
jgi:hypothetical protein